MVGKLTLEIKGAKELEKTLKEMGPKVATRLGDKALRAGAKPIVTTAKALCPRGTGALRRSITAVKQRERGGAYAATRTVLVGFKKPGRRYAHLVEFGHAKVGGGSVPAKPFMRPALDSKAQEAIHAITNSLADGILRQEWRKALGTIAAGQELFPDGE